MKWSIDTEDDFFKIYDSKNLLVGYFDPNSEQLHEKQNTIDNSSEKSVDSVYIIGGFLVLPMVKFNIFSHNDDMSIDYVESSLVTVSKKLQKWKSFLSKSPYTIQVSHNDYDMLSITIPIKFEKSILLQSKSILNELTPFLDSLHESSLL